MDAYMYHVHGRILAWLHARHGSARPRAPRSGRLALGGLSARAREGGGGGGGGGGDDGDGGRWW